MCAKGSASIIVTKQRLLPVNQNLALEREENEFSNSLIIHEEKTKEITTVKEVWICDPNYHKIQ